MKKKISKKGMLSLMTVSAIAVTMVGSYAVWDQTTATGEASLILDKPITIATTNPDAFKTVEKTRTLGTDRTYTTKATFTTANVDQIPAGKQGEIKLTPKVMLATDDVTDYFTVTIKNDSVELTGTDNVYEDSDLDPSGTNEYEITLALKDVSNSDTVYNKLGSAANEGTSLEVKIEGTLVAVEP